MPFRSEAQKKYLYIHEPKVAKEWEKHTPKGAKLPEHVGKMSTASTTFFSLHFPKSFTLDAAKAWAKKRGFKVARTGVDSKGRKGPTLWSGQEANGFTLKPVKLTDDVIGMRDGFDEIVGKYALQGAGGGGGAPALNDTKLPDYKAIYYQPETEESIEQDEREQAVRRTSLARQNAGKYGLHGATTPEPQVRYHPNDYPAVTRGQANETDGKPPKLIVRGTSPQNLRRKGPPS